MDDKFDNTFNLSRGKYIPAFHCIRHDPIEPVNIPMRRLSTRTNDEVLGPRWPLATAVSIVTVVSDGFRTSQSDNSLGRKLRRKKNEKDHEKRKPIKKRKQ